MQQSLPTNQDGRPGVDEAELPPPEVPDHQLIRRIGRGAYGEVWLARNVVGTFRAVKVVYRRGFTDPRPFEREFAGIQRFEPISRSHEGLVDVLQIGRNDRGGFFYYVMELGDGEDGGQKGVISSAEEEEQALSNYRPRTLATDLQRGGRLRFGDCLRTALALAEALEHLHRNGLVHRDIKPSNIIFVNGVPKLADIGLVTEQGEASWVGTEGFIAPEGQGRPPADIYSLGKVLYEMSTGKDRQHFPEPLTVLAELPDRVDWLEFNEIVTRACEFDPRRRYTSATELRTDLVLLSGGKSVRKLRQLERTWRRARIVSSVIAVAALASLMAYAAIEGRARGAYVDLLWKSQTLKTSRHFSGWRANAWNLVRAAADIRRGPEARDQAAALLEGLDARVLIQTNLTVHSLAFDAKGERLLAGGSPDTTAFSISAGDGKLSRTTHPGMSLVAVRSDGRAWLYGTNGLGQWCVRDWQSGGIIRTLDQSGTPAFQPLPSSARTVSADGAYLAAAGAEVDGKAVVSFWDCDTGRRVASVPGQASAMAFAPDNSVLAIGEPDGRVRICATANGAELLELNAGARARATAVHSLAFARKALRPGPTGTTEWILAAGDAAGVVTLWDLETRLPVQFLRGSQSEVTAVAFNADATLLASGGRGSPVVWDVATGEHLLTLDTVDVATALVFSRDNRHLAAGGQARFNPGVTTLWELEPGRGIRRLRGLSRTLTYVAVDNRGQTLAALSHDWRVGVWSLTNGQRLAELEVPAGVTPDNAALALHPDGRQLAVAAGEAAHWWDLPSGRRSPTVTLPRGLGDRLAYRSSGELVLFRQETLHGLPAAPSSWWQPASVDPRVFRIRNLFNPASTLTVTGFNCSLKSATIAADGSRAFVEAPNQVGSNIHRRLAAIDLRTGTNLWSRDLAKTVGWGILVTDLSGRWLSAEMADSAVGTVLDGRTGAIKATYAGSLRAIHGPSDLRLLQWSDNPVAAHGWMLCVGDDPRPKLTLSAGLGVSQFPIVFDEGRQLAWGLEDGTVILVDLPRVRRELSTLGLDW